MPSPNDNDVLFRINPYCVTAVSNCGEARRRCRGPLLPLGVKPPQKTIIGSNRRRCGRHLNPLLGYDLFCPPLAATQEQITKPSLVASADPQTSSPSSAATHRNEFLSIDHDLRVAIAVILPGI